MMNKLGKAIDHLEKISKELAANHVRNSIIPGENNNFRENLDHILDLDDDVKNTSSRNVVIIGSGASYDAFKNIFPLGKQSVELIEEKLGFKSIYEKFENNEKENPLNKVEENIYRKYDELHRKLYLDPNVKDYTFETRLALLSHFVDADIIRKEIAKLFDYKTYPSYFYGSIAHLLKNRFIDGIINFNFDELLDQAIEEEMGDGHLIKVLSDGDCKPYKSLLTMKKLREPFYIKPHGTASHKSSLRFTRLQYLDIPDEIEHLMEEIFIGDSLNESQSSNNDNSKEENKFSRLNLIIFGFAMESIEFNAVLRRVLTKFSIEERKPILNIYYFSIRQNPRELNYKNEKVKVKESWVEEEKRLKNIFKGLHFSKDQLRINVIRIRELVEFSSIGKTPILDKTIDFLFTQMTKHFNSKYSPLHVDRYKLLNQVFFEKGQKDKTYFNSEDYYLERVIFEIILVVLKNKGYIQPKESLKGINRIGLFYHLYYDSIPYVNETKEKAKSIHTILYNMGLSSKVKAFAAELYTFDHSLDENVHTNNFYDTKNSSIDLEGWRDLLQNIKDQEDTENRYCEEIVSKTQNLLKLMKKDDYYKPLLSNDSLTLYPNFKDYQLNAFGHIDPVNIIPTTTALNHRFLSHFLSDQWQFLLLVSDRGLNLIKALEYAEQDSLKGKKILLILSDVYDDIISDFTKNIEKLKEKTKVDIETLKMPYYDHNTHLKLFFDSKYLPTNALFYFKRGFSNNINAVHLRPNHNTKNIMMLLEKFLGYFCKAKMYQTGSGTKSIAHFDDCECIINKLEDFKQSTINQNEFPIDILLKIREKLQLKIKQQ